VIKVKATILLRFDSPITANKIRETISPDNSPVPDGLEINVSTKAANLEISITCTRGIDSFRNTIEDIMSSIDLSLRTISTVFKGE
jgi:hypothetical protein